MAACALLVLLTSGCAWVGRISLNSAGVQRNDESGASESSPGPSGISPDGRYVAFESAATNLVTGDTNNLHDVFVRDAVAGTTIRVSVNTNEVQANAESSEPALSSDARYVSFESDASNLVAGDTNGLRDVFVRDTVAGTTSRVSVNSLGVQGDFYSFDPAISADGRYVAFWSIASNLVTGDTNDRSDVFVRDTVSGTTNRVSVGTGGTQATDGAGSERPTISPDGRYVVFDSDASNLVAGDANGTSDVFVRDTVAATTIRVSVNSAEAEGNETSGRAAISADGRYVAFDSLASNLVTGDTNNDFDVFVRDTVAGTTSRVSVANDGHQSHVDSAPAISADGRFVTFESDSPELVANDTNDVPDVFVHDRIGGTLTRVSTQFFGGQANLASRFPSISADGSFIAFSSEASNLVSGDTNNWDVFVKANPEPTVTGVAPATVTRGTTTSVTVSGSHFLDGALLVIKGGGVTIDNVTVVGETQITADVNVATDATLGARNVFVELAGTGPGPAIVAAGLCSSCVTVH